TNPILTSDAQRFCNAAQAFTQSCSTCHKQVSNPSGYRFFDVTVDDFASQLLNADAKSLSSVNTKRLVANDPGHSEIYLRIDSTKSSPPPKMPLGSLLGISDIQTIQNWIQQGPFNLKLSSCNTSPLPDVKASEAFAYLTASNAVDGIWSAVMGYPL